MLFSHEPFEAPHPPHFAPPPYVAPHHIYSYILVHTFIHISSDSSNRFFAFFDDSQGGAPSGEQKTSRAPPPSAQWSEAGLATGIASGLAIGIAVLSVNVWRRARGKRA